MRSLRWRWRHSTWSFTAPYTILLHYVGMLSKVAERLETEVMPRLPAPLSFCETNGHGGFRFHGRIA